MNAPPRSAPGPHLILVGLMGAGKTTVGRLLAAREQRPFLDSDEVIEQRTGRTVREIFETDGEAAFRALEADVLRDAIESEPPAVIAAAGGTVLSDVNRRRMRDGGTVIWLDMPVGVTTIERVLRGGHRPLLDVDPVRVLETMANDRAELYAEVADHRINVGERTPDEVADEIIGALA